MMGDAYSGTSQRSSIIRLSVINSARAKREPAMKTKLAVLLLCCAIGSELKAQSKFQRLKTVDILIENLTPAAEKLGLTRGDLESVALVALKSKVPKITVSGKAMSYVYVNVTLACSEYACAANADVVLPANLDVQGPFLVRAAKSKKASCGVRFSTPRCGRS